MEKWSILLTLVISSSLGGLLLYKLARRGRNLQKFRDRQLLQLDLYRFTVAILFAFAWYLAGSDLSLVRSLPLPDSLLLLLNTALPTFVLCLLSGRWYLGYAAALVTQAFILFHLKWEVHDALHGALAPLWAQQALLDLAGLIAYAITHRFYRTQENVQKHQQRLLRFQSARRQKAGHAE